MAVASYVLDEVQTELFVLRADFYAPTGAEYVGSEPGMRDPKKRKRGVLYADVPCYRRSTPDATQGDVMGRSTQDIILTADELHMPMSYIDENGDPQPLSIGGNWSFQLSDPVNGVKNPDNDIWFVTLGQTYPKTWLAKKQIVLCRYDVSQGHLT